MKGASPPVVGGRSPFRRMHPDPSPNALPWATKPFGELVRLAWPIAVSMLSYSVMTLVDTLFVGHLGEAALAGVGLGGILSFALSCFSIGLLRSVKVLVSQELGAGRKGSVVPILGAGLWIGLALGVLSTALGLVAAPWVESLASGGGGAEARTYFVARAWGAPLLLWYTALREARYGIGDSRTPMRAALWANVANVIFNGLLIHGLKLGVAGSAWATTAACAVEAAILWSAQRPDGFGLREGRSWFRPLLRIGGPTGIQFLLEVGSFSLLGTLIARMGTTQMAAHQIAVQILHFSFLPAFAISEAASVLAGQAVGAGEYGMIQGIGRRALAVALGYAALCGTVFLGAGSAIIRLFTGEPELQTVAFSLLAMGAVFQLFDAANIVARGVLRGTGDVRVPAVVGILTAWVATPPLTWFLGVHLGYGALGGWMGLALEIVLGASIFWFRLERGFWRGVQIGTLPAAVETR